MRNLNIVFNGTELVRCDIATNVSGFGQSQITFKTTSYQTGVTKEYANVDVGGWVSIDKLTGSTLSLKRRVRDRALKRITEFMAQNSEGTLFVNINKLGHVRTREFHGS